MASSISEYAEIASITPCCKAFFADIGVPAFIIFRGFFFFKQNTAYEISECDWSSDVCFFFFKQKTAYEISECDWSSDVCSSDLRRPPGDVVRAEELRQREEGAGR